MPLFLCLRKNYNIDFYLFNNFTKKIAVKRGFVYIAQKKAPRRAPFQTQSFMPTFLARQMTVRRLPTPEASPTVSDFFAPSIGVGT